MDHLEHNRRQWDRYVARGQRFTRPVEDRQLRRLLARLQQDGWLRDELQGRRVLCLAAGGGKHGILYALAGAEVTVVDLSGEMLALDRQLAARHRLVIRTVQTSMEDLSMFPPASFQVVVQPVSTCYVPRVQRVFEQVARVLEPGGLYVSQHKQPAALQASSRPGPQGYVLRVPYDHRGPLPEDEPGLHREAGTREYLHTWEALLGGMCRAGFVIEDLQEPRHGRPGAEPGSFAHRSRYLPPFVRVKARRRTGPQPAASGRGTLLRP